mgnify:CR=1 FL=1
MNDLSMLQKRVLTFVKAFLNNYGYSPSVRDIAKGCDIKSTSTVHTALNVLEQKGYITRDGGQSRSTVLTGVKLESGVYSIPLRISEEKGDSFGVIDIPKSLVQDREGVFAVKAPFGFEKKNIVKGDILVAKAGCDIQKGDMVIFDDLSLGIFDDKSDSFQEDVSDIDELEILDGFEEIKEEVQDVSEAFEKKDRLVLGKVIVCIRHL